MDTNRPRHSWLHFIAAMVLFLFAASHFADLIVGSSSHRLDNTVFPFFTNKTVYLIAAFLEMVTAVLCWKLRGRDSTNVTILTFVGVILWYRWAFHLTGGFHCGCAGIFGKLLHLSKAQEKSVPIVALSVLVLTTIPWIYSISLKRLRKVAVVATTILFLGQHGSYAEIIEIQGEYRSARYNPETQRVHTNSQRHINFVAELSEHTFDIRATNVDNGKWARLVFDGTNTHELTPYDGVFVEKRPDKDLVFASISPSPIYLRSVDERMDLFFPWLTFGLSPSAVPTNSRGIVDIPLPWAIARIVPGAWGYRWVINFLPENRFVEDCQVIREHALDLEDDLEMQRAELNAPETVADKNMYRESIRIRKKVPNGFVNARYKCTEWYRTNDIAIPMASELKRYLHPNAAKPFYEAKLKVTAINIRNEIQPPVTPPRTSSVVTHDYRYARAADGRNFNYVEYDLQPGQSWKSDRDPSLLAQVEQGLKADVVNPSLRKNILAWLGLAVLVLVPILAMLWVKRGKTTN